MIKVNDKWGIDVDKYNYVAVRIDKPTLDKRKDKEEPVITYKAEAYYKDLAGALKFIAKADCAEALATKEEIDINNAINKIKDIYSKYENILWSLETVENE